MLVVMRLFFGVELSGVPDSFVGLFNLMQSTNPFSVWLNTKSHLLSISEAGAFS